MKVCGLTRAEDVSVAVEAGADAVGFICGFPKSPRNISVERAGELIRDVPPFVDTVLVTNVALVSEDPDRVRKARPTALQLYGAQRADLLLGMKLGVRLILAYRMNGGQFDPRQLDGFDALLSDTYMKGEFGGTGQVSDWTACKRLREAISPMPFVLSGGLNPANVKEAVLAVRPYAVDASSGLESGPGTKDRTKVEAFVRAAKELA